MINVSELTKFYGVRCAVENLSFTAQKGEVLGFLGPNGAGKTTTMRILSGFMPPSSGKVTINGLDIIENSLEIRKIVGYLPETVPLYPDMRVFDYLKYMADLRQVKDVETRIIEVLEMVDMTDRSESFIRKLSKGMRQRVGLAQALIHEPEVLILDEPTIGLDPAQIREVRTLIQKIGKEKTVLLSTHILSEAQQICDRVLIINKGHIVAEDSPEKLQDRLTGIKRIHVSVKEGAESVATLAKDISGIISADVKDNRSVIFDSTPSIDPRAELSRKIVKAGFDLLEIYPETISLEDVFLGLIREENATPEIQAPAEPEA